MRDAYCPLAVLFDGDGIERMCAPVPFKLVHGTFLSPSYGPNSSSTPNESEDTIERSIPLHLLPGDFPALLEVDVSQDGGERARVRRSVRRIFLLG